MKKFLYITNIPTPYRQARFNLLSTLLAKKGIELEVLYMAKIEKNRNWIVDPDSFKYKYKIYWGVHPTIKGFFAHFNPGLLLRLLRNDYQVAVVGGMASPTHWLAPCFIGKNKTQIMSIESNLQSTERKEGLGSKIKGILLGTADLFQVTGTPQMDYVLFFQPKAKNKDFIKLPNLIQEQVFVDQVAKLRLNSDAIRANLGVNTTTQIWVLPARIIEIKGVIPFLELMQHVVGVHLFVLGNGDQEQEADELVKKLDLPVTLVGYVQQNDVIRYYAAADLFVLPSIKDPSPLSPIEAIAGGLPILVSSRIGNLEDVLVKGKNGWSYDPLNEIEVGKKLIEQISEYSRQELKSFASNSSAIFNQRFKSENCLKQYVKDISQFYE